MQEIVVRAQQVKLLILDVDGVLSDGRIYLDAQGIESKAFHVHDGLGIKLLQQAGIPVAVISSRNVPIVTMRMRDLGVEHIYQGQQDKLIAFNELLNHLSLLPEQVAYVGDDLVDIALLRRVGFGIAVANANAAILPYTHWTTTEKGGAGAVREVCEFLLTAQNKWQHALAKYISR